jgi:hypothetical protein
MSVKPASFICALALMIPLTGVSRVWAQGQGKTKDDSLDSLLKELNEPEKPAAKSEKQAKPGDGKAGSGGEKGKAASRQNVTPEKNGKAPAGQAGKPSAPKSRDAGKVSSKDQALDELLGKLGETKDEPAAEDRPRNGPADGQPRPPSRGEKAGADKLGEKDKDLDARLEELTGRKKKRPSSDQQRTGPVGEMIKEMREVEERLGKPDPSEDTQKKQKQIVKRIESMIEQAKRSGSSGGRMVIRRIPGPGGQQPGQNQGDQTGAQARGAPPMKPAKPTTQHSTANGKDIWGHLPDSLRLEMQSIWKEIELDSKRELITRYFLSVAKGKPKREE